MSACMSLIDNTRSFGSEQEGPLGRGVFYNLEASGRSIGDLESLDDPACVRGEQYDCFQVSNGSPSGCFSTAAYLKGTFEVI